MKSFILALVAIVALVFASSAEAGGLGRFGVGGCGPNGCGNFSSRVSINHRSGLGLGLGNFGGGFSHNLTIRQRQGGLFNRGGRSRQVFKHSVNF